MTELKPKSFRIEDETFEKFKTISAEIGGNQQETLELLIGTYEVQKGKESLVGRKEDIEQFEKYINALMHMYMRVLEDNQNMKETTRVEFKAQLDSKDEIIINLQKKEKDYLAEVEHYKITAEQSQEREKEQLDSIDVLHENLDHLSDEYGEKIKRLQSALADKENLNCMLNKKLESMEKLEEENKILSNEIKIQADKIAALENQKLEFQESIISLKENHNNKIAELKEQYAAEIDKYQAKYKELLEKLEQKAEQTVKKATTQKKTRQTTKKVGGQEEKE